MDAGTINIILKAQDQYSKAMSGAEQAAGSLGGKLGEVARTAGGFVVGSALTDLPGKLLDMAKGAADDAASTAKLEQAVRNAEGSFDGHASAIDGAITKGQQLAFSDDDVRDALALMTATTGDADEALRRLHTAQDLARGTGMDLATASKLLGRVNDENINVLSRYGIQVEKGATAQELLNAVDSKFSGQAATFAASDAGKMAIMSDKVGELQEQLGAYLIPVLALTVGAIVGLVDGASRFLGVFEPVASFIQGNLTPILIFLAPALVGVAVAMLSSLVPAVIAGTVALWAQVAAWIALNVGMLPIIGIFLLIGAALVGLYLAWQSNFLGIQDITTAVIGWLTPYLQTAWELIQTGLSTALTIITTAWNLAWTGLQVIIETVWPIVQTIIETAIGIIQTVITTALDAIGALWGAVWPAVQAVIETVWPVIQSIVETTMGVVQSTVETVMGAISGTWDTIWGAIQGVAETIWGAIQATVETAIGAVQSAVETVMGAISGTWDTIWGAIQATAQTIWDAISGLISTAIGTVQSTIETGMGAISGVWDTTWGAIQTAVDNIWNAGLGIIGIVSTGLGAIKRGIEGATAGITGAWQGIWDTITGAVSTAYDTITGILGDIIDAANGVIDKINGFIGGVNDALSFTISIPGIDMPGPIPDIPGTSVSVDAPDIPNIPRLAAGGIVKDPLLAWIGDGHGPEAVIPLDRLDKMLKGTGGPGGISVNYYGPVTIEAQDRAAADRSSRDIGWAVTAALRARGAA